MKMNKIFTTVLMIGLLASTQSMATGGVYPDSGHKAPRERTPETTKPYYEREGFGINPSAAPYAGHSDLAPSGGAIRPYAVDKPAAQGNYPESTLPQGGAKSEAGSGSPAAVNCNLYPNECKPK